MVAVERGQGWNRLDLSYYLRVFRSIREQVCHQRDTTNLAKTLITKEATLITSYYVNFIISSLFTSARNQFINRHLKIASLPTPL